MPGTIRVHIRVFKLFIVPHCTCRARFPKICCNCTHSPHPSDSFCHLVCTLLTGVSTALSFCCLLSANEVCQASSKSFQKDRQKRWARENTWSSQLYNCAETLGEREYLVVPAVQLCGPQSNYDIGKGKKKGTEATAAEKTRPTVGRPCFWVVLFWVVGGLCGHVCCPVHS